LLLHAPCHQQAKPSPDDGELNADKAKSNYKKLMLLIHPDETNDVRRQIALGLNFDRRRPSGAGR